MARRLESTERPSSVAGEAKFAASCATGIVMNNNVAVHPLRRPHAVASAGGSFPARPSTTSTTPSAAPVAPGASPILAAVSAGRSDFKPTCGSAAKPITASAPW